MTGPAAEVICIDRAFQLATIPAVESDSRVEGRQIQWECKDPSSASFAVVAARPTVWLDGGISDSLKQPNARETA
jgi:hypothetical protein